MNTIEISDVFRNYLKVIYNRFINKDEKWHMTQSMYEDPIFYTSITYYNMIAVNLVDLPEKTLVYSDHWEMNSKKVFDHGKHDKI